MKLKVALGQLCTRPDLVRAIPHTEIKAAVERYRQGDWGDTDEESRRENDVALKEGTRLFSTYQSATGLHFCITTEPNRSLTTVFLPAQV